MNTPAIKVRDYMTTQRVAIECDTALSDVVNILLDHKVIGAPVTDTDNKVIGFVSEQDCIKASLQGSYYCDLKVRVNEVMATEAECVAPDADIVEMAQKMLSSKHKVYPVVDQDNHLLGSITRSDVLRALISSYETCR